MSKSVCLGQLRIAVALESPGLGLGTYAPSLTLICACIDRGAGSSLPGLFLVLRLLGWEHICFGLFTSGSFGMFALPRRPYGRNRGPVSGPQNLVVVLVSQFIAFIFSGMGGGLVLKLELALFLYRYIIPFLAYRPNKLSKRLLDKTSK